MLYNQNWEKPTTVPQLLRKAASLMETRGMAKGYFIINEEIQARFPERTAHQRLGSMCLQGVLQVADGASSPGWHYSSVLYQRAILALSEQIGYGCNPVATWNNDHKTTQEMAVAKLRETADQLELVGS